MFDVGLHIFQGRIIDFHLLEHNACGDFVNVGAILFRNLRHECGVVADILRIGHLKTLLCLSENAVACLIVVEPLVGLCEQWVTAVVGFSHGKSVKKMILVIYNRAELATGQRVSHGSHDSKERVEISAIDKQVAMLFCRGGFSGRLCKLQRVQFAYVLVEVWSQVTGCGIGHRTD